MASLNQRGFICSYKKDGEQSLDGRPQQYSLLQLDNSKSGSNLLAEGFKSHRLWKMENNPACAFCRWVERETRYLVRTNLIFFIFDKLIKQTFVSTLWEPNPNVFWINTVRIGLFVLQNTMRSYMWESHLYCIWDFTSVWYVWSIQSIMVHMVHNSWMDGPLEDRKISAELSWRGLPSDDKMVVCWEIGFGTQKKTKNEFARTNAVSIHLHILDYAL